MIYDKARDEYWIYYTRDSTKTKTDAIGLATCPAGKDGYSAVTAANIKRYAGNPVLAPKGPGREDERCVSQGAVFRENGLWYMFYSYRNATKTLPGIRLATSRDGKRWTKVAGPDLLTSAPEQRYIEWHQVYKIGSRYVMFYEGYNGGIRLGAQVATSSSLTSGMEENAPANLIDQTKWSGLFGRRHVPRCHAGNLQDQQQVVAVLYRRSFGAGLWLATLGHVVHPVR